MILRHELLRIHESLQQSKNSCLWGMIRILKKTVSRVVLHSESRLWVICSTTVWLIRPLCRTTNTHGTWGLESTDPNLRPRQGRSHTPDPVRWIRVTRSQNFKCYCFYTLVGYTGRVTYWLISLKNIYIYIYHKVYIYLYILLYIYISTS